jgi:hypothetical protein
MFRLVFPILPRIPIEAGFSHAAMVSGNYPDSHTKVWLTLASVATSNVPHHLRALLLHASGWMRWLDFDPCDLAPLRHGKNFQEPWNKVP